MHPCFHKLHAVSNPESCAGVSTPSAHPLPEAPDGEYTTTKVRSTRPSGTSCRQPHPEFSGGNARCSCHPRPGLGQWGLSIHHGVSVATCRSETTGGGGI